MFPIHRNTFSRIVTLKPDHLYLHTFIGQFTSKKVMIKLPSMYNTEDQMESLNIIHNHAQKFIESLPEIV